MKYLRIIDNEIHYPYQIDQLRIDYPNTSFPEKMLDERLIDYGIHRVNLVNIPSDYTKNYNESIPNLIDGHYYQNWNITDASEEEINQRIEAQWSQVRIIRNQYLQDCDWTQLPDSPLTIEKKGEWTIYRQALRDLTLQEDPFDITWPVKPE